MAKDRKNKVYVPRMVLVPGIVKFVSVAHARPDIKLLFHSAVMAFTVQPTNATCNQISAHLCKIAGAMSLANNGAPIQGRKDKGSISINLAIAVIESVAARYEISDDVTITEYEAKVLRKCAGGLDAVLSNVPEACYERAEREVDGLIGEAA